MTEKEKRDLGLWYDANFNREISKEIRRANDLCFQINSTLPSDKETVMRLFRELIPDTGENVRIATPFLADYGYRISIGSHTFINHNAYLMDGGGITIGSHCFLGPDIAIYTALHPLLPEEREQGYELAKPVIIEDSVWTGGRVTILPGVRIGKGAVIGAGSVVTKDIPPMTIAYGNPARIIREITSDDTIRKEI